MPRPKPKQSSPTFVIPQDDRPPLTDEVKERLLALLGNRKFDRTSAEYDPTAETMRHQMPGYRELKRQSGRMELTAPTHPISAPGRIGGVGPPAHRGVDPFLLDSILHLIAGHKPAYGSIANGTERN